MRVSYKSKMITLVLALAAVFIVFVRSVSAEDAVYVTPHLISDSRAVVAGQSFKLGVHLDMAQGWHTYYKEPGDAGMKTSIDWQLPPGFEVSELIWQKPEKFIEAGITTYGYHDKVLLAAVVTAPGKLTVGDKLDFKAKVKWLSCKEICLPGKGDVELRLPVATSSSPSAEAQEFQQLGAGFKGSINDIGSADSPNSQSKTVSVLDSSYKIGGGATDDGASLFTYLGFALIGGLILNIMPCVLPVIAIKVMSFLEQAQDSPARVRLLGLTFSAGIISSFLVLALVVIALKAGGQSIGWGFQFQYPGFLIVMCAVVLLMSLSFFGLFYVNITVGQGEIDKLSQGEGFVGTFFKGVLATVLSTPCTAPLLAPALGFAFAEPAYIVLSIFFAAGLGMSLPYLLLTLNPAWLQKLPKPGAWMEKFKQSMGFILLATMVWLDYVLTRQIGAEPASFVNYWLVTLAFSAWIVASFTDLTSTSQRKMKIYAIAALVFGAASWFCIFAQPQVMASLSPSSSSEKTGTTSGDSSGWQPFSVSELNAQLSANKTVLLDFTADWCQTCQVNEKTVLSNSAVQDKLKELNVVKMKADWTRQDPDITKLLSKFGRAGVPLYVIFPAGKSESPIVLPEVITVQLVVDELDKAGKSK
ncbi:thioredoxin family protein [bacterium]|nr:thioredoxin family protein [bacterium]MBP9809631.1 thioredoxin family protein [bacterium]